MLCQDLFEREIVVVGGDLNGLVGKRGESYVGVHGEPGYGIRNNEGARTPENGDDLDMVVHNTLFKKRPS